MVAIAGFLDGFTRGLELSERKKASREQSEQRKLERERLQYQIDRDRKVSEREDEKFEAEKTATMTEAQSISGATPSSYGEALGITKADASRRARAISEENLAGARLTRKSKQKELDDEEKRRLATAAMLRAESLGAIAEDPELDQGLTAVDSVVGTGRLPADVGPLSPEERQRIVKESIPKAIYTLFKPEFTKNVGKVIDTIPKQYIGKLNPGSRLVDVFPVDFYFDPKTETVVIDVDAKYYDPIAKKEVILRAPITEGRTADENDGIKRIPLEEAQQYISTARTTIDKMKEMGIPPGMTASQFLKSQVEQYVMAGGDPSKVKPKGLDTKEAASLLRQAETSANAARRSVIEATKDPALAEQAAEQARQTVLQGAVNLGIPVPQSAMTNQPAATQVSPEQLKQAYIQAYEAGDMETAAKIAEQIKALQR